MQVYDEKEQVGAERNTECTVWRGKRTLTSSMLQARLVLEEAAIARTLAPLGET